jgi:hypothetical protein
VLFPVVVRSLERKQRRDLHGYWDRKWSALSRRTSTQPLTVATPGEYNALTFFNELMRDDIVSLSMHFNPRLHTVGNEIILNALSFGIPVAMWSRAEEMDDGIGSKLTTALTGDVRDLPKEVLKQRRTARARNDTKGWASVVLLWDDPTRIPGEKLNKLVAPA